jgi:hypothetical protein
MEDCMAVMEPIDLIMQRLEKQMAFTRTTSTRVQIYLSPEAGEDMLYRDVYITAQLIRTVGLPSPVFDVLKGSHECVKKLINTVDALAMSNTVISFDDNGVIAIITLKRECPPFESQRAPLVTAFLVKGTVRVSVYAD